MLDDLKKAKGAKLDTDLTAEDLNKLVKDYKAYYLKVVGEPFPIQKFNEAVTAVFVAGITKELTFTERCITFHMNGAAVNVQTMVL